MSVRLCAASDSEWQAALDTMDHDIYHRPDYCSISARVDGGTALAVLSTSGGVQVLIPLIRRSLDGDLWDAISPYGYGGPITTRGADPAQTEDLLKSAFEYLAEQGCVSVFLRMHPGLNARWPSRLAPEPEVTSSTTTVALPLEQSEEESLAAMKSGHRYQVRLSLKNGYSVLEDVEGSYWRQFAVMYRQNMDFLGATQYYLFDDAYFEALLLDTAHHARLWVVLKDDEVAAAAIFTAAGDWVQYHLAASDPAHRKFSPGKLLIHAARMAYRSRGPRWLHLGGGVGGTADSLFEFKAGFGGDELSYRTAGLVLDVDAYQTLSSARDPEDAPSNFFPAYRAPD